ncbi:hypothetical protein [Nocardia camponoti]|uniref:Uncharacterized protein n=1 Tax=Nocardia camponoti TaxID=1616106 RepID=A0A917QP91_9NOCA|nr:hypothetical protein [Nocardia camponoti]GGK61537.1 hypothetical protein GCM10011591_37330 [Nocardia camponoti]
MPDGRASGPDNDGYADNGRTDDNRRAYDDGCAHYGNCCSDNDCHAYDYGGGNGCADDYGS